MDLDRPSSNAAVEAFWQYSQKLGQGSKRWFATLTE
jgi:hypothetical protein